MTATTTDDSHSIASTPSLNDLSTVAPRPVISELPEFDQMHGALMDAGADAILDEIWRLTRNERYLELEAEVRGEMVPTLQLTSIAANHTNRGILDPTGAARQFITTVRNDYGPQLGKHAPDADVAIESQDSLTTAATSN